MNHSFSLILHNEPSEPTAELLLDQKHHLNLIRKVLDAPRDFHKNSLKCRSPSIHTHTHAHTWKGKKKKRENHEEERREESTCREERKNTNFSGSSFG